ncbi:hypothetical protein QR680_002457 [Steinernema hermaphroditum]|uniref:Uncharacterized protein n=1 Tax=Steinernema hermaphroditum TaxID=289476 RepID=A0AA39H2S4_9BILA|nr:hypothetical protein QR680_002457 [Steinernema hermaphroditum]
MSDTYWNQTDYSPPSLFALASKVVMDNKIPLTKLVEEKSMDKETALRAVRESAWAEFQTKFGRICWIPKQCIVLTEDNRLNEIESFHEAGTEGKVNRNFLLPEMMQEPSPLDSLIHMFCGGKCNIRG